MLGDGGANALGALVGSQVAFNAPRAVRWATLVGVVGLMAASEKVSFSKVIAGNEWLNKVDMLGRRPAPAVEDSVAELAQTKPVATPGA
jgi:hypothetical protein